MRKQIQKKFKNYEIATDEHTACDVEALKRLEKTLDVALHTAENPRVMRIDIAFPVTRTNEVNQLFRAAQADYVKAFQRKSIPVSYVGYKDPGTPSTIRMALIYDSEKIVDDALVRGLEHTINRKIADEYEPVEITKEDDSTMLTSANYDQVFYEASSLAKVKVVPEGDRRVLFASRLS